MTEQPGELVYLIGSPGSPLVKIGRSKDVDRRVADLQRMSPVPLEVLAVFPGGAELESALHKHFKEVRAHGEWFELPDPRSSVSAAVANLTSKLDQQRQSEIDRVVKPGWVSKTFPAQICESRTPVSDTAERYVPTWPLRSSRHHDQYVCYHCQHPIGTHLQELPHFCVWESYADHCLCAGYEGPLPEEIAWYELPGYNWRLWAGLSEQDVVTLHGRSPMAWIMFRLGGPCGAAKGGAEQTPSTSGQEALRDSIP